MATSLTDTQGIIAIGAGAVAVLAVIGCFLLAVSVRRLRQTQRVVLGERSGRDLVAHSAELQASFDDLRDHTGRLTAELEARIAALEAAMTGTIAHRALVRYDAYNEFSGRQSMSIALLDSTQSGIVLSCIHHRDQARVYAKQINHGRSELELSPEEEEAVREALSGRVDGGVAYRG
jgi:Protein of unknown function (DUF4446)